MDASSHVGGIAENSQHGGVVFAISVTNAGMVSKILQNAAGTATSIF
jgi:hypothetical protein